jgi:hypothetical protein
MSIQLYGRWNLRVTKAIHNWENRFRVEGATTGSGTYPPTVGLDVVADGAGWSLIAEYRESDADSWKPSEMMIDRGIERVDILAMIGAEDPLPSRDFEDIQWDAQYLDDTMLEIPYRPYAVRTTDLFQMPDGIFEAALGTYYMAVRVINRWGLPFTENHVLDITPESRAILAARGIIVIDSWSSAELAALGQTQLGNGIVLGPLVPGAACTVYFKVNVSGAAPRKHEVEFVCWNMAGMQDANNPVRRVRKHIFVSRTSIDQTTGEVVSEVQEGTLRFNLKQFAFDRETAYNGRRRLAKSPAGGRNRDPSVRVAMREALKTILEGREVDPCEIFHLLACHCTGDGRPGRPHDPNKPSDGRFEYDPFYAFPTRFSFSVTPRDPYTGQYGPIPYQDPWWKVLLLIIAAILLIAALLEHASDVAYHDEDLVIGTLDRWQQNDIDAALCLLDTDRALGFRQVLDAQSDEDNQNFINALDGLVTLNGPVMTRAEINLILTTPPNDPQRRVFKSGATTGLTHGIIRTLAPDGHDKSTWGIDQLIIDRDQRPAFGEDVSIPGDSGSVWVHTATLRPIALNHSGSHDADGNPTGDTAWASLLEDVFDSSRMNITL